MTQTIRIRRGTKGELINYGALKAGELGFCTDTKEVFVGDDSFNHLVGGAMKGTLVSRPAASTSGRFFFVISGEGKGSLYLDDGTAWQKINVTSFREVEGTIDDIKDGLNFKKVRAEDVTEGHVNKLSDGNNITTAEEVKKHVNNEDIHRKINDAGTGITDIWSADKVKTEIFNAIKGLDWQDSVISIGAEAAPSSPKIGDRYIVGTAKDEIFEGKDGQIAHWNGSVWEFYAPTTGWAVYVEDQNKNYTYSNAGKWVVTGGANQTIVAGAGLVGGGSGDSVTIDIVAGQGIVVTDNDINVKGGRGIKVGSEVEVNIDNKSIVFDEDNGYSLVVGEIDGGSF